VQPLIEFVALARLALVFEFQLVRPHQPEPSLDLRGIFLEQRQLQLQPLVVLVVFVLDVLGRARRLRCDRPRDVGPLGRPCGELTPSCRRTGSRAGMLNRALALLRDFARGV
jgi:hypothetical protein